MPQIATSLPAATTTIATAIAAIVLAAAPVGRGDDRHMLVHEVSPGSLFHGRILLKLSKKAIGLLHRCRLQTGNLLVKTTTRLRELANLL